MPFADTEAMQGHREETGRTFSPGAHGALLLDRAGRHTTGKLNVARNMTQILPLSHSPEFNPVESIWQYRRANCLYNRAFETYEDIIDAACGA
jgi:hypothetical protein